MAPNYADVGRVGKLETVFVKFHLFKFSKTFYSIVVKYKYFQISKDVLYKINKSFYYRNDIDQTNVWPLFLF